MIKKPVVLDLSVSSRRFGGVIGTRLARSQGDRIMLQIAFAEVSGVERIRFAELLLPADLSWREGVSLAAFHVRQSEGNIQLVLEICVGEESELPG